MNPIEKTENVSALYRYLFKGDTGSLRALGYPSIEDQLFRFQMMYKIGITVGDSILDVGCGYGDFIAYLFDKIGVNFSYKGIDVRPEVIQEAKNKYENYDFAVGSIYDESSKYDWVIGCGIFSLQYPEWEQHTSNTMASMFSLCKKGVAVNFLPKSKKSENGMLKSVTIEEVQSMVLGIYDKYVICSSMGDNDITVYLFKDEK